MPISTKLQSMPEFAEQNYSFDIKNNKLDDYFNALLLEAVDNALSFLGESAKRAVYYHLEEKFKIEREKIPLMIEEFANAIEDMFGIGAKIIEIQIMKNLYRKIGSNFKYVPEEGNLLFSKYLKAVKNHFVKARREYVNHESTLILK